MAEPNGIDMAKVQALANDYGKKIFTTVEFHVQDCGADEESVDRIYSAIHQQLVEAFAAGYMARASGESS
jgi:hypothetical protein